MLISKFWAICEVNSYNSFSSSNMPIIYFPKELCDALVFLKPNLCNLVIKNKESNKYEKYEFYVLQSENLDEKLKNYEIYTVSIPVNIYHELIGFKENQFLSVRTDLF